MEFESVFRNESFQPDPFQGSDPFAADQPSPVSEFVSDPFESVTISSNNCADVLDAVGSSDNEPQDRLFSKFVKVGLIFETFLFPIGSSIYTLFKSRG